MANKKTKKKSAMPKLDGIDEPKNVINGTGLHVCKTTTAPDLHKDEPAQDNRLMREGEDGVELYARIVQLPKNKRVVIVCPYLDGFLPGRMVLPKRGRERKVMRKTDDGYEEITIPGKFSKRGARMWVRPVDEVKGLYIFIK